MKRVIMLMVILTGISSSCNEDLFDRKTIIGKWELISQGINADNMIPINSNGGRYIEYFSDGTRGYYDTITEEIRINGNYQIRSGLLIYNYDKSYDQGRVDYKCDFIHNNNQLKLTFANGLSDLLFSVFIYQRIK